MKYTTHQLWRLVKLRSFNKQLWVAHMRHEDLLKRITIDPNVRKLRDVPWYII